MDAGVPALELSPEQTQNRKFVRWWLYIVLVLLLALVLVGGATRMTGSGLSITEWKPIHGMIPPLSQTEWHEEFVKYQQIAQYQHVNKGMTLEEFKGIFWWEWGHRALARFIGFAVAIPLLAFWLTKRLERKIQWRLLGLLFLGGMQGAIGWWMVASGLGKSQLTSVSQYRLAIHLVFACIIIIAVFALARSLAVYKEKPASRSTQIFAGWMVFLVLFQIYLGALVAGLHAGLAYNTWPLMDGRFIPDGLLSQNPLWKNLFENALTVQFVHRMFAYILLVAAIFHAFKVEKLLPGSAHARRAMILLLLIIAQAVFGIITLLTHVPIEWGLIHQGFALLVMCFAVAHWIGTKGMMKPSPLSGPTNIIKSFASLFKKQAMASK
ncbi:COX15/CtaA family protein [Bartonella sp. HY038]|uniref:COX15/CtaA family protein n=1 Tax=Bartonella sp. HY038 TaxID=2759660 RepID=UPI0015F7E67C|nr:COX15/CtaA family protein [Bartonella sp. HY038]